MGIMENIIRNLAQKGEFARDVDIDGTHFVLGVLDNDEMLLADGMIDMDELHKEIAGDANSLNVYSPGIESYRSLTRLAIIIRKIDNIDPLSGANSLEDRIEMLKEFRRDLRKLDPTIIKRLNDEYNELIEDRAKFFEKPVDTAKK